MHGAALALGTPYESPRPTSAAARGGGGDYFSFARRQDPLGDLDGLKKSLESKPTVAPRASTRGGGRQLETAWAPFALGQGQGHATTADDECFMMEVDDDYPVKGQVAPACSGGGGLELESPFAERFGS
jgi:hypothetical protein